MHSSQQGYLWWSNVLLWSPCPFVWTPLVFLFFFSVFFLSPISTSMFSVAGVPHFHQCMGQKLAVWTFPAHGLLQNMFFFIVGGNQKKKHKGTSSNQLFLDCLWLSHFSFGILWFLLISFGFLCFGAWGWVDSMGFPLVSFVFLWWKTKEKKPKEKINQSRKV